MKDNRSQSWILSFDWFYVASLEWTEDEGSKGVMMQIGTKAMVIPFQDLSQSNSDCNQQQDVFGITVGVVLLVGTVISYVPQVSRTFGIRLNWQHLQLVKVIWEKTTEGLSFEYMFLTLVYNWTVSLNAILLQWDIVVCINQVVRFRLVSTYHTALGIRTVQCPFTLLGHHSGTSCLQSPNV